MSNSAAQRAVALRDEYLPYRPARVPFPPQSVAFFVTLLALQREAGITGDMLELGVQYGGTALLTINDLGENERQFLIDYSRDATFAEKFDMLPHEVQQRVTFIEQWTDKALDELTAAGCAKVRFLHIDAGHSKEEVQKDIRTYAEFLAGKGLLCFDDVFEIRWPGVTEAVMEELPRTDIVPVAIVDRKLYCCRKDAHDVYDRLINDNLDVMEQFGELRVWREPFLGAEMTILKLKPDPTC